MANVIRIKRRASGAAGAPATLKSAELAHNEVDNTLYIGKGDDGTGNATTIVPVGGKGSFADLSTAQTIGGAKTFSTVPKSSEDATASNDLVRKAQLDTALSGKASTSHPHAISDVIGLEIALDGKAASLHGHAVADVSGLQNLLDGKAASSHAHAIPDVSGLDTALDAKAPLLSPEFVGTPTAPTPMGGTNSTQIATTAFVQAAITAVINGAPGALDTLKELADALGNDGNFATTLTNALASKLTASLNLSDLTNVAAARTNLGLGSIATQNANNLSITGGAIDGITIDGGTF